MEDVMARETLSLAATTYPAEAYRGTDFVIVATPTDYDPAKNYLDTSSVETVIDQVRRHNQTATIVIKSTIPVRFIAQMRAAGGDDNILFSPSSCARAKRCAPTFSRAASWLGAEGLAQCVLRDYSKKPALI